MILKKSYRYEIRSNFESPPFSSSTKIPNEKLKKKKKRVRVLKVFTYLFFKYILEWG